MATKIVDGVQLSILDGVPDKPYSRFIYAPGERAALQAQTVIRECEGCEIHLAETKMRKWEVWQPFADSPDVFYFCEDCVEDEEVQQDFDEDKFWCDDCNRQVYTENGYRPNMLRHPESNDGDYTCAKCFQDHMLENGHSWQQLERMSISCDFYSSDDLIEHGWREAEVIDCGSPDMKLLLKWKEIVKRITDNGLYALTDQGRTSIMGGPDDITVYWKFREDVDPEREPEKDGEYHRHNGEYFRIWPYDGPTGCGAYNTPLDECPPDVLCGNCDEYIPIDRNSQLPEDSDALNLCDECRKLCV